MEMGFAYLPMTEMRLSRNRALKSQASVGAEACQLDSASERLHEARRAHPPSPDSSVYLGPTPVQQNILTPKTTTGRPWCESTQKETSSEPPLASTAVSSILFLWGSLWEPPCRPGTPPRLAVLRHTQVLTDTLGEFRAPPGLEAPGPKGATISCKQL